MPTENAWVDDTYGNPLGHVWVQSGSLSSSGRNAGWARSSGSRQNRDRYVRCGIGDNVFRFYPIPLAICVTTFFTQPLTDVLRAFHMSKLGRSPSPVVPILCSAQIHCAHMSFRKLSRRNLGAGNRCNRQNLETHGQTARSRPCSLPAKAGQVRSSPSEGNCIMGLNPRARADMTNLRR